ncbi:class I SAM-dependent methyltransferase [Clostridium sp. KNHs216]|uniref:class I SAM-dependent methyltransferase n=1 Tax=Clostridium sp. KNHs216 TaxID=1550235 RepID=UPI001151E9B5|nr:class I SAM-dependent methyltransferase [Clostridium sp. KNHs216]TQI67280.1 methyltransferase family protein [Clostridium sp. KNHs216]
MKVQKDDWYKHGWTLDIKNQSWVEDTENQVDFIIKTLRLTGKERILDLACGYGRHTLSLARKGYPVVGVDITPEYIDDARKTAKTESLNAYFINSDIRAVRFENEFDVVLNLADDAIGYLETDEENLKIFDAVSHALKSGGKHFMDICNAEHAEHYFPRLNWEAGEKALALAKFEWDKKTHRMLYGGCDIPYGIPAEKPDITTGDPTRLYSIAELNSILQQRKMNIIHTFSNYYGKEASPQELQLLVYSKKQ